MQINVDQITEVGPRDGLQSITQFIPTDIKKEYILKLIEAGLKRIEVTSFVSAKAILQLADATELMAVLPRNPSLTYTALVPNDTGLSAAIAAEVNEIAIFASASEQFSMHNIGCDISTSLDRYAAVTMRAHKNNLPVRGYISCSWSCPYGEIIDQSAVKQMVDELINMGCYQVVLSDTTGSATPIQIKTLLEFIFKSGYRPEQFAMHFHDTNGQAINNTRQALALDVMHFDSATGGLGGCPNAPGSTANLATELLVDEFSIPVDVKKLQDASDFINQAISNSH